MIFGQKMTKNRFFFQKKVRACGFKFSLIKLSYFKFEKIFGAFLKDISTTYMYFSMSGQGGQET